MGQRSSRDHSGQWMRIAPRTVAPTDSIRDVLPVMAEVADGEVPVVDASKLVGIITIRDCLRVEDANVHVQHVMNTEFFSVGEDFSLRSSKQCPLYVIQEKTGTLLGIVGRDEWFAFYRYIEEQEEVARQAIDWMKLSLDTAYEGVVIVDERGIIQLFNDTYARFVGVTKEEAIGRAVEKVIENTRLPVVLKTGVPERSQAHRLQGQELVVHRLPMWRDGKVIGAVGMLVYEGKKELLETLERMDILDYSKPEQETVVEKKRGIPDIRFEDIIGESAKIAESKKMSRKAARTTASVLITGESGVGKEPFAQAIHNMSARGEGPFVAVNCAAIPENLLESELFGYVKGAFTGTKSEGKPGKMELAHGGTLFLDEIGDMPLEAQAKVLRALQSKEIDRVGSTSPTPVDFRLISATNQDLKQRIRQGKFRADLYYRLHVIDIPIPPLRERKRDIPLIIAHQLKTLSCDNGAKERTMDKAVIERMFQYDWPGNVRELIHVVERMFHLCDDDRITIEDLPGELRTFQDEAASVPYIEWQEMNREQMQEYEQEQIEAALQEVDGNKSKAAKKLGISRATLYNKMSRFQRSMM
ncbi:sigma-54-dependent Fis family transcriptional regulator [Geomicrobium sp. JCM 19037]|uniref:sigma-54-dependent Fis family transcriptional regulator n=1 Tax=Geomicrobium sp. JCM 19037 TaxID=1460634 RepID=UPI000B18F14A|nr:sigma-54-dependent Fis family transcriptional regulator [Geomicrobium sp. JCM 19037]